MSQRANLREFAIRVRCFVARLGSGRIRVEIAGVMVPSGACLTEVRQ